MPTAPPSRRPSQPRLCAGSHEAALLRLPAVRTSVRLRAAAATGRPSLAGSPARGRGGARGGRHPLPRATARVAAAEACEAALDLVRLGLGLGSGLGFGLGLGLGLRLGLGLG